MKVSNNVSLTEFSEKNACQILYVSTWREDIFVDMCTCERIIV